MPIANYDREVGQRTPFEICGFGPLPYPIKPAWKLRRRGLSPSDAASDKAERQFLRICDPEQKYFTDGMVEVIITALSRIRWFFVIARNSSFTHKGRTIDVKQVARELGGRYFSKVRFARRWSRSDHSTIDRRVQWRSSLGRPLRWFSRRRVRASGQDGFERRRCYRTGIAG